jgi:hypothetical protein
MLMFSNTYRNTNELALEILSGQFDRQIYGYLWNLTREKGFEEIKKIDPTGLFNFEIELLDRSELLFITPWDMNSCTKCGIDLSEQERKIVLLLAAIIREKHHYVMEIFKPLEPTGKPEQ